MENVKPKISIVIPTYNRLSSLKKCLLSVLENDYPDFEIIIVDDFSEDGTREYLKNSKFQIPNSKFILNEKNLGASASRNRGIENAQGEWVAFIDDDCQAEKNWLSELVKKFENEKIGFVIGNTIYFQEGYRGNFPERLVDNDKARWPGSGNIAYRKKCLDEIGGFDEKNFFYANEDTELALRSVSVGWKYERSLEAKVYHEKCFWDDKSLLRSAHNISCWPLLKKKYPKTFQEFKPTIVGGVFFSPEEYLYIILMPLILPILALRYFFKDKSDWKTFFAKWPCWLILKRFYLWKEAWKEKTLVI